MKLRIKDNSLRFRLLRGEVQALARTGRIAAHTLLSATDADDRLTYAIEHAESHVSMRATRTALAIVVLVPTHMVLEWAASESVGIYGEQQVYGGETLDISIEKDFACLDRSDVDNSDTFENPNAKQC